MRLALGVLLCLGSGFALVSLGWPRLLPRSLALRLWLAPGFGLGIFSVVGFLCQVFGIGHMLAVDVAVFASLVACLLRFRPKRLRGAEATPIRDSTERFRNGLTVIFAAAICVSLYFAVLRVIAYPHGDGWDAFAIWNLHARFLFRGGAHWRDAFSPLIPWSHPDYPLLLPASIAHFWTLLGRETPAVPAVIGFLFTFSTAGLLFSSLSLLRGRTPAMLGAIALLTTPAFIEQGTAQYADVPLSFFMLATIALLNLHRHQDDLSTRAPGLLASAGIAAGFAAWTKNEGLLFLGAIVVAHTITSLARTEVDGIARLRQAWPLLLGIIPMFALIVYFKHFIAGPGDLFSNRHDTVQKLLEPGRYWAITSWYVKEPFRFGHWLVLPGTLLMIVFYVVMGKWRDTKRQLAVQEAGTALALTLAGFFAIYLITPRDIYWHLRFSLPRLFLQLWPSVIFVFFVVVDWGSVTAKSTPASID